MVGNYDSALYDLVSNIIQYIDVKVFDFLP